MVADTNAAAYTVLRGADRNKARILFRLKRVNETNGLVSLRNARHEIRGQEWQPVQLAPETQNYGGVAEEDDKYYAFIDMEFVDGQWRLVGDLDAFSNQINRTALSPTSLPEGSKSSVRDIISRIARPILDVTGTALGAAAGARLGNPALGASMGAALASAIPTE
jgi:hypothetical protein